MESTPAEYLVFIQTEADYNKDKASKNRFILLLKQHNPTFAFARPDYDPNGVAMPHARHRRHSGRYEKKGK
jgi:hypothetical protein